jgi:hypothetical protein
MLLYLASGSSVAFFLSLPPFAWQELLSHQTNREAVTSNQQHFLLLTFNFYISVFLDKLICIS